MLSNCIVKFQISPRDTAPTCLVEYSPNPEKRSEPYSGSGVTLACVWSFHLSNIVCSFRAVEFQLIFQLPSSFEPPQLVTWADILFRRWTTPEGAEGGGGLSMRLLNIWGIGVEVKGVKYIFYSYFICKVWVFRV